VLEIVGLNVRFGGVAALSNVSLKIEAGQIVGMIGPNGSGKTTMLNAISKQVRVSQDSTIIFCERDLKGRSSSQIIRLGIARTFQAPEVCGEESVLETVITGGHHRNDSSLIWCFLGDFRGRRAARDILLEAMELVKEFEIEDWANQKMSQVPYAIAQRAQICRAVMAHPKLLLLDEAASGMTPSEKDQLRLAILRLRDERKITMLIIEHDVSFLSDDLSDVMVALDAGKVIAHGLPGDVLRDPAVVTAYLGSKAAAAVTRGD